MPYAVPSKWYACVEHSPRLKDEKYYSIWGTPDDHIYGREKLEEKYERVEDYIPNVLKTVGIFNFVESEWDKIRPEEEVTEEEIVFGMVFEHPVRQTILSEKKYKCTGELETTD